jgi:predicted DNA-binding transcriptional regulator AlpA
MLKFHDLPAATGLRLAEINRAIAEDGFPKPTSATGRLLWWPDEVANWVKNRFCGDKELRSWLSR